ncbi:hypothetical protein [Pseudanabaena sp. PCC 6802]|uniref:hypothetical protein n=1 Tax=Pseudanabaena sp. PCC 6802 TaxID=118173 RepID=UPI000344D50B|nr:hypothetical protein [Pseudanabaena sp. PCC 6802]
MFNPDRALPSNIINSLSEIDPLTPPNYLHDRNISGLDGNTMLASTVDRLETAAEDMSQLNMTDRGSNVIPDRQLQLDASQLKYIDSLTGLVKDEPTFQSTSNSIVGGDELLEPSRELAQTAAVNSASSTPSASEWQVISENPSLMRYYSRSVDVDRNTGAVGLNKQGYISVGLQRHSSQQLAYGLLTKDITLLDTSIKVLEYGFDRQQQDGSFQTTPLSLSTGVSAQDTAFFFYDVGHTLLLAKNSTWFQTAPETANLRSRLQNLLDPISHSLSWLNQQSSTLQSKDKSGTNRLFIDANAYYLVGKALGRDDAIALGKNFARMALQQQSSEGFFLERGGYDSSYNAVALRHAILFYMNLEPEAKTLRQELWQGIEKGINWQLTRIAPSGEVLTAGNTRILPSGEQYALTGTVKKVDYKEVILALDYYAKITGSAVAQDAANRVRNYRP